MAKDGKDWQILNDSKSFSLVREKNTRARGDNKPKILKDDWGWRRLEQILNYELETITLAKFSYDISYVLLKGRN